MSRTRVSIQSIMIALVIIAIDFATLRSIETDNSQDLIIEHFSEIVLSILAMTNLLALVGSRMIRDGLAARPWRWGFLLGGLAGIVVTALFFIPMIESLERNRHPWLVTFESWTSTSPVRQAIVVHIVFGIIPLLFQGPIALAGGWFAARLSRPTDESLIERQPTSRRQIGSLVTLVILLILPIPVVKSVIHWNLDPDLARLSTGLEAVVDFRDPQGAMPAFPKGSPYPRLNGVKVRVLSDDKPMEISIYRIGQDEIWTDSRPVQVTLLEGERNGDSVAIPHSFLRPAQK